MKFSVIRIAPGEPMRECVRAKSAQDAIFAASFRLGYVFKDGREVQSIMCNRSCDPTLWQLEYRTAVPGNYEMDSSMRVVRR